MRIIRTTPIELVGRLGLLALGLHSGALPAKADESAPARGFAIVRVQVGGTSPTETEADAAALASIPGALEGAEAVRRFEARHSVAAQSVNPTEIELWANRSRAALRHLSRGDYAAARSALLEAQRIAERAAEAMNRETVRARQVLDTCLYVVRASLETHDLAGAEQQARQCRHLVPRLQATAYSHPPEVRELLARIDAELADEQAGTLEVGSEPSGCTVRINGVYFGTTPLATSELGSGDYRVQVECDEGAPGRVHAVRLGSDDVRLDVDVAFENAIRSSDSLALAYADVATAEARAARDARTLARALEVGVVIVRPASDGGVLLEGVGATGRVRTAHLSAGASSSAIAEALHSVEPAPVPRARSASDEGSRGGPRPGFGFGHRARRIAGATLLAAGAAASGTAVGLLFVRDERADHYASLLPDDPGYLAAQESYHRANALVLALPSVGATLATTGAVVATPGPRFTWYGVALGLAGLGLASWAVVDVARAPACGTTAQELPTCLDRDRAFDRAAILAGFASPMIGVPVTQVVRADAGVSADRRSVLLTVRSRF